MQKTKLVILYFLSLPTDLLPPPLPHTTQSLFMHVFLSIVYLHSQRKRRNPLQGQIKGIGKRPQKEEKAETGGMVGSGRGFSPPSPPMGHPISSSHQGLHILSNFLRLSCLIYVTLSLQTIELMVSN